VCPKCKESLTKAGLQEAEVNFKCRECGESFEQPTWMHGCRKCKFNFTLNEASFIDVFSYVLSADVKDELEGSTTSLAPFRRRLEELGFKIPLSTSLKGKSGSLQPFDLIAKGRVEGRDFVIALDMVSSTEPLDVVPVSTLMGKLIDTGADVGVLVAIPSISQAGRNLAELYDILVIEADDAKDAGEEFERRVRTIVQRAK